MKYTIIAFTENKPGILYRIADLFLRRKINIESLTVSETETHGVSRFTIVVDETHEVVEKVVKQLYRIIEVIKVFEMKDSELISKEIAFIKVSTKTPDRRRDVEELVALFGAKISDAGHDYVVAEITGSEDEVNTLYLALKPFGVKEFVQSGRIAVVKDGNSVTGKFSSFVKEPSHVVSGIELSAIKKLELMGRENKEVVSLAQGIPSFATPAHIKEAAKRAIDAGVADKYTAGYGIKELREAIAKKLKRDNKIDVDPSQVTVTHGGIEAMIAAFIAILNRDDEIVFLTPDYASHITQAIIAHYGGKPVFVPLNEKENWRFEKERLQAAITTRTKAILLCNPSNPIGKAYAKEELMDIVDVAKRHNLYIITDETYEYFTFDNHKHISIASLPGAGDRTISIFSLSKSYSMTGWRIGYIAASKDVSRQIFKVHDSIVTCPTAVSQYAAIAAIDGSQKDVQFFRKEFQKRRDIVIKKLKETNKLSAQIPEGGYFAFVKVNANIDDYELCVRLIKEAKVAVVPGSAFGAGGNGHIRISFGCEEEQLKKGLNQLIKFVNKNL